MRKWFKMEFKPVRSTCFSQFTVYFNISSAYINQEVHKFLHCFLKKIMAPRTNIRDRQTWRLRQIPCLDVDKVDNRLITNSLFFRLFLHMLFLTVYSILCDWQIITEHTYFWMWGQFLTFFIQECKITLGIIPAKKGPQKLDLSLF